MDRTAQKNDPVIVGIVSGVAILAILACLFFAGREVARDAAHKRDYQDWRQSIMAACRSFKEPTPPATPQPIREHILQVYYGQYPLVPETPPGSTPEEWDQAVRFVAVVVETYEPTGYEYVDEKSKYKLGIQAVAYTFNVRVCDMKERSLVASTTIVGAPPPETVPGWINAVNGVYGILPFDDLDAWLATLKGQ